jgi:hypothetical protein
MSEYDYADPYLTRLVTDDREERATADVDAVGTFADPWRARLIVLRVYVLICIESIVDPSDAFSAKLNQYRKEYEQALIVARAARATTDAPAVFASIPLERA